MKPACTAACRMKYLAGSLQQTGTVNTHVTSSALKACVTAILFNAVWFVRHQNAR